MTPASFDPAQFDALARAFPAEVFRALLSSLATSLPGSLHRMDLHNEVGDLAGIGREAHILKGFSSNFGAIGLYEAVTALEAACDAGDAAKAAHLIGAVKGEAKLARAAIVERMSTLEGGIEGLEEARALLMGR